nr:uncharacterized protein LOC109155809 [Ipomoea batatas]
MWCELWCVNEKRKEKLERPFCFSHWWLHARALSICDSLKLHNSHLLPGWLVALLTEKFFSTCIAHEDRCHKERKEYLLRSHLPSLLHLSLLPSPLAGLLLCGL